MLQDIITDKLQKLSGQIDKVSLTAIEKELIKFNPTDKTVYDFRTGCSDTDDFFLASFNFRALYVKHESKDAITFFDFFYMVMQNIRADQRTLEIIDETLDHLLKISSDAKAVVYPAMFLDEMDGSIACRFKLKKYYHET